MPLVEFTRNLASQTAAPTCRVEGATVNEALAAVFAQQPALRGYVLDDQGRLRQHVVVYIDGERIGDPAGLGDAVGSSSEVYVMQALSGG